MKALILVGGYGTRLRPLTLSRPKPCVEFANKPIVCHQIEALAKVGVTEVILAISYQPDVMREYIARWETTYDVKITCSVEHEPLGTAGPIAFAREALLRDNTEGIFFLLNSDIICEYPFAEMLAYHKAHGREGTISVCQVDDPSKYGVVISNEDQDVVAFVEKPKKFISNKINCGMYILSTSMIDHVELRPAGLEREIFPMMVETRQLKSYVLDGFWMDIGQPKDFLEGNRLYLSSLRVSHPDLLATGEGIIGNVIVAQSAVIEPGAVVGPDVSIGPNCVVKSGARVANSAILDGSSVGSHSLIRGSIVGWKCKIGKWVRIEGLSVLGEDVRLADEICLNITTVLPHKELKDSVLEPRQIIM